MFSVYVQYFPYFFGYLNPNACSEPEWFFMAQFNSWNVERCCCYYWVDNNFRNSQNLNRVYTEFLAEVPRVPEIAHHQKHAAQICAGNSGHAISRRHAAAVAVGFSFIDVDERYAALDVMFHAEREFRISSACFEQHHANESTGNSVGDVSQRRVHIEPNGICAAHRFNVAVMHWWDLFGTGWEWGGGMNVNID